MRKLGSITNRVCKTFPYNIYSIFCIKLCKSFLCITPKFIWGMNEEVWQSTLEELTNNEHHYYLCIKL